MTEIKDIQERKRTLNQLVDRLINRMGLSAEKIRVAMSSELEYEYGSGAFLKFHKRPEITSTFDLKEVKALVQALTNDIDEAKRCTAREAIQIFDLTAMELKDFHQLIEIYPQQEFDKAWTIYQAERNLGSKTISAPSDYFVPLYPHVFVGREDNVKEILIRLGIPSEDIGEQSSNRRTGSLESQRPFTIVRGWPGVGKTTLINRLVYDRRINQAFKDGILWCSLGPDGNILLVLKRWARQLHAFHLDTLTDVNELVLHLRATLQGMNVLVVVDDVWTTEAGVLFRSIGGPQTMFLMTTRFTDVANAIKTLPGDVYILPTLTKTQSRELLQQLAPQACNKHPNLVDSLIDTLEGLPLALRVASELIEREESIGLNVEALAYDLEKLHLMGAKDVNEATGTTLSIEALFERSVKTLAPLEQKAFAYLGMFAPKPATFDSKTLKKIWEIDDPNDILRALIGRGLLEPLGAGRFQMHYTLIMYAHSLLEKGQQ